MKIAFNLVCPHPGVTGVIRSLPAVVLCTFGLMVSSQSFAADCKGQIESACVNASACSWVESYTRKDGREVNAFCRSKGKAKKAQSTANTTNKQSAK
ncbi:MAG: hypothetical protein AAF197_02990 [Pseudomonadota bacterium]